MYSKISLHIWRQIYDLKCTYKTPSFTPLKNTCCSILLWASQVVLEVKKKIQLPMQETEDARVRSLGLKNPLEKEMTTHSSILAWRIPWTEEPGRLWSIGWHRVDTTEATQHGILLYHLRLYSLYYQEFTDNLLTDSSVVI